MHPGNPNQPLEEKTLYLTSFIQESATVFITFSGSHPGPKMNCALFLLASTLLVAAAEPQNGVLNAAAVLTRADCNCQCSRLVYRNTNGIFGNCFSWATTFIGFELLLARLMEVFSRRQLRNKQWCYVVGGARSPCVDLRKAKTFRGQYWSFQACATPLRTSSACQTVLGKYSFKTG